MRKKYLESLSVANVSFRRWKHRTDNNNNTKCSNTGGSAKTTAVQHIPMGVAPKVNCIYSSIL
eukprot:scaffold37089_cov19-Prasinocladus_malaysianus.AAC.1